MVVGFGVVVVFLSVNICDVFVIIGLDWFV